MHKQIKQFYEFGPFHLDMDERLLMREGRVVPLSPKVFDTLLVLVENSGRILGKDELMQTLWPDTYVEESNLTQNISQIRRALGNAASESQYIETIPKRGYRFVAPVQVATRNEQAAAVAEPGREPGEDRLHQANGNGSNGNGNSVMSEEDNARSIAAESSTELAARPGIEAQTPADSDIVVRPLNPKRMLASVVMLFLSLAIVAFALFSAYRRSVNTHAKTAFQHINPAKLTTSGKAVQSAISRDGRYVAYVLEEADQQSLWVRQVAATSNAQVVAPAEVKFQGVTFSIDDGFIYYVTHRRGEVLNELYQVPLLGGTPKKVLSDVDSPVTFSPNGQYVAFLRNYPQQREVSLITAKLDGFEERKLFTRKRPETLSLLGASWSPDGRLIACAAGTGSGGDAVAQIVAVNIADGSAQPIGNQNWTAIGQLAWLGDGSGVVLSAWQRTSAVYGDQLWLLSYPKGEVRRITSEITSYEGVSISGDSSALVVRRSDRVSRIWIVPVSGNNADAVLNASAATQIQSGFGDNYSEQLGLDWTPDGRLIYATHASGNLDIWSTTTDGKQQKQLTRDALTDVLPTASGDGRYIVFSSERSGTSHLWRMDADGGNPKQLTNGKGDSGASLSPDGKWVVYSSLHDGKPVLWKVSIDGDEPVQLSQAMMTRPIVSPDGKWIACFYQDEKDNKAKIAVIPFAGGDPVIVETMALPEFNLLRWSPDSRALTYIVTRQDVSNVWSKPIDGGEAKQLTDFTTDHIFRFAWSRDGKSLACERGMVINDVLLINSVKAE